MSKYSSYIVCGDHISEVREFLAQFFNETKGDFNHEGWSTFEMPNGIFSVNLMIGKEQPLTQNMTYEIYVDTEEELEELAKKYRKEIKSFIATEAKSKYKYHYINIFGPEGICKMEISYSEMLK